MGLLKVAYYPEIDSGPVREYLDGLYVRRPKAGAKLALDLELLAEEGSRKRA